MTVLEAGQLRTLEDANRRLKKLLAEPMLDVADLKDLLSENLTRSAERFAAVAEPTTYHRFSKRRAFRLIEISRPVWQYKPLRGQDHAMREIANERRWFDCWRLAILLRREGRYEPAEVYRLYRGERLTVRKHGSRKRALGARAPMAISREPKQHCSLELYVGPISLQLAVPSIQCYRRLQPGMREMYLRYFAVSTPGYSRVECRPRGSRTAVHGGQR